MFFDGRLNEYLKLGSFVLSSIGLLFGGEMAVMQEKGME